MTLLSRNKAYMNKVWLLGMYDLSNYGDCLFPFIFSHKLKADEVSLQCVSLTGIKSKFIDAFKSISLHQAEDLIQPNDTLIVGGGNLICDVPMSFFESNETPYNASIKGTDLWLRGLEIAKEKKCKTIINGAGAFAPLKRATLERWEKIKSSIDYIAWRDYATWRIMGSDPKEHIIPDTSIDPSLSKIFLGNSNNMEERHILVNLRPRAFNGMRFDDAVAVLDKIAETWELPLLCHANSYSHNDFLVSSLVMQASKQTEARLEEAESIKSSFERISRSSLVITSSMHTYITAASGGRNVILISRPRYNKFEAVAGALERRGLVTSRWSDLEDITKDSASLQSRMRDDAPELNEHWKIIKGIVKA